MSFLGERGIELAIPSLSYLILNIYIGRLITDNAKVFERCTILYIFVIVFISLSLYIVSLKTRKSLTQIFNDFKVKIFLTLLLFLDPILYSLCKELNVQYTWVPDWLLFFKLEIAVFGLLKFYFDEKN